MLLDPSFLAIHPNKEYLYAVNEHDGKEGIETGKVSAFAIDKTTKNLSFLNDQVSKGTAPCHVSVTASGKYALVANYSSGSIAALPIKENGQLAEPTDIARHKGKGTHPRQESPHAHFINSTPDNQLITAIDLGT